MRLIDSDVVIHNLYILYKAAQGPARYAHSEAIDIVTSSPTVDPSKHGRWESVEGSLRVTCSACRIQNSNYGSQPTHYRFFSYCPDCGAKMDLEVE